jgi:hypothetical protein
VTDKRKKTPTVVTSAKLDATLPGTKSDVQLASERLHTG